MQLSQLPQTAHFISCQKWPENIPLKLILRKFTYSLKMQKIVTVMWMNLKHNLESNKETEKVSNTEWVKVF